MEVRRRVDKAEEQRKAHNEQRRGIYLNIHYLAIAVICMRNRPLVHTSPIHFQRKGRGDQ